MAMAGALGGAPHDVPGAAPDAAGRAVCVFGGQGIPSGQLAELRKVVGVPEVAGFVARLSRSVADDAAALTGALAEARDAHLAAGIDIAAWAEGDGYVDKGLMECLPVSLVLTFAAQLANFRYCWVTGHDKDGGVPAACAAGHSQGMAAAMVTALADTAAAYEEQAARFARVLLVFGLCAAEAVAARVGPPDAHPPQASKKKPAGQSFARVVLKAPVSLVRSLAAAHAAAALPGGAVHVVVVNGAEACTVTGAPAGLASFEKYVKEKKARGDVPVGVKIHSVPVAAPFHWEAWLGGAAEDCVAWLRARGAAPLSSASLQRPLYSCVDGAEYGPAAAGEVGDLEAYLVRALAVEPVDWPAAVAAMACDGAAAVVDYGPGGGSGAAQMTRVVAKERGAEYVLHVAYFTQRYGVAGRLPESWLEWVKAPHPPAHTAGAPPRVPAEAAVGSPEGGSAPERAGGTKELEGTKARRKFIWFSERVKAASAGGTGVLEFTPELMAAIAPELQHTRRGRAAAAEAFDAACSDAVRGRLRSAAYAALKKEQTRVFDAVRYPFRECFAGVLGQPAGLPLAQLHSRFHGDQGSKRDRREKRALLHPLTDPALRRPLVDLYEAFVLEVLAPAVAAGVDAAEDLPPCDAVVFSSFPCVRVHRPGEFSIGPHCDAEYQLPDGSVNVWLPLTDAADTNSIYVETTPGAEDFHPLNLPYGAYTTFHGACCAHFAVENTTPATRISLDFRLIPGPFYDAAAAHGLADEKAGPGAAALGSYFSICERDALSGVFAVTQRGYPNHRHGFPHTNR